MTILISNNNICPQICGILQYPFPLQIATNCRYDGWRYRSVFSKLLASRSGHEANFHKTPCAGTRLSGMQQQQQQKTQRIWMRETLQQPNGKLPSSLTIEPVPTSESLLQKTWSTFSPNTEISLPDI